MHHTSAAHVRRVVVDEAHILPQVEHAFRKDYRRIGPFIESLPKHPQVLAFTATATCSDLNYIAERLCMHDPKRLPFPDSSEKYQNLCQEDYHPR